MIAEERDAVVPYRPPDWCAPSPRELRFVVEAVQTAWGTVRESWRSYLGPRAEIELPQITGAPVEGGVPALKWRYGEAEGQVRCDASLLHAIGAAAAGFDAVSSPPGEPMGSVELAVVRAALGAVLEPQLRQLVPGVKRRVEWYAAASHEHGAPGFSVTTEAAAAGVAGDLTILLPLALVRPAPLPLSEDELGRLRSLLSDADGEVEACIPGATLGLIDLEGLEPGDVVLLDPGALSAVDIRVAGLALARGQTGARGGRLAVRITRIPAGGDDQR